MPIETIINVVLAILSFCLAVISVVTVIITLKQNKELLRANALQLEEMRKEHQLSSQPIITCENVDFSINRPRFYYAPPTDAYSYQSTYVVKSRIKNITSSAAINIDISACLSVHSPNGHFELDTCTERCNILSGGESYDEIGFLFAGDTPSKLYEALREGTAEKLPRLKLILTYKNTSGGCFVAEQHYLLIPPEEETKTLAFWHARTTSGLIEEKETLDVLKKAKPSHERDRVFKLTKELLDAKLGDSSKKEISIKCREIEENYRFKSIDTTEYKQFTDKYSYPRYIHKEANCKKVGN